MNCIKYLFKDFVILICVNFWLILVIVVLVVVVFYFVVLLLLMSVIMVIGVEGGGYVVFVGKFWEKFKE